MNTSDPRAGMAARPAFWFGVALVVLGISAAIVLPVGPADATRAFALLLIGAGLLEFASAFVDHRAGRATGLMDGFLSAISIGSGGYLLTQGVSTAALIFVVVAQWLMSRGAFDLLGAAIMRPALLLDGRLLRGVIDLILGLVCCIALTIIPWWELMFGWPNSALDWLRFAASISVITTGVYLVSEARIGGRRQARRISDATIR